MCWDWNFYFGYIKLLGCNRCSTWWNIYYDYDDYDWGNDTQADPSDVSREPYDSYVSCASYVSNASYTYHVFILFLTLLKFLR